MSSFVQKGCTAPYGLRSTLLAALACLGTVTSQAALVVSSNHGFLYEFDSTTGAFVQSYPGTALGSLTSAIMGQDGLLYVVQTDDSSVKRFNPSTGTFIDDFITPGSGGMSRAIHMDWGPNGNLYVNTYTFDGEGDGAIHEFDRTTGAHIGKFADINARARDFEFGPDGDVYVIREHGIGSVQRYDGSDGSLIGTFTTGATLGQPHGLTWGPDGNLYVSDYDGNVVRRFNGTTGAFETNFATGLSGPHQLKFGPDGNLYINNFGGQNIRRYDGTTGAFIDVFASHGPLTIQRDLVFTDGFSLSTATPEPSSALLFVCGIGLVRNMRQQRDSVSPVGVRIKSRRIRNRYN